MHRSRMLFLVKKACSVGGFSGGRKKNIAGLSLYHDVYCNLWFVMYGCFYTVTYRPID